MISKKIHSEQLLQLVLALSLLRVDPTHYYSDFGFESLVGRQGNLQILQPHPSTLTDINPYVNRKDYIPLIEDLARFDRSYNHHVEAYLLNVSDDNDSIFLNSNSSELNNTTQEERNANFIADLASRFQEQDVTEHDVFLNSEIFDEAETLTDQNYQDLHDWQDVELETPMPTKIEVPDIFDDLVVSPLPLSYSADPYNTEDLESDLLTNESSTNRTVTVHSKIIKWDEYYDSNSTTKDDEEEDNNNNNVQTIKKENENAEVNDQPLTIELTSEVMDFSFFLFPN